MRERLIYALASAGVPVDTVTGDGPGCVVAYMPGATQAQRDAGAAILAAFDWSESAQVAWELGRAREAALASFFSRDDETAIAVRAFLTAVIYLTNNRLEALGQPRVLAAEILGFIAANPTIGDPQL